VATVRARSFDYSVALDEEWSATSDRGGAVLPHDAAAWTPEHLLLTALVRCSLTSLGYHARRSALTITSRADARGTVTRRESDGRFGFVSIELDASVTLDPPPEPDAVRALLAKAERDCFVGASLTVAPAYRWTVNGEEIA
jgi:organic hydroperoxide reductase OsmC/OhrA